MRKRLKKRKKAGFILPLLSFLIVIFFILILTCNTQLFPTAIEISQIESKAMANEIIDKSLYNTIHSMDISSSDFFIPNEEQPGTITANTLLINQFCSSISSSITKDMQIMKREDIPIPIGTLTGVDLLSALGPEMHFSLYPMGSATVDYDTSFNVVGINQINFKIWLDVSLQIKIVNPLRQETVALNRKIMLVDTVMSGTVPDHYLNFNQQSAGY